MNKAFFRTGVLSLLFLISACQPKDKGYWDNGNCKFEISKSGGKMNGLAVFYYEDGNRQMQCTYKDDKLNGKLIRYTPNGIVIYSADYQNDRLYGIVTSWNDAGKKISEENYIKDTLHGAYRQWYENGMPKVSGNYRMGIFDGEWLYYDIDGKVFGKGIFKNGCGILVKKYPRGTVEREVPYTNGKRNGEEKIYTMDEKLAKVIVWQNDKKIQEKIY
jgi:antitoxin component YwqK of YwqJK toxin-antitoxin module